MNINVIFQQYFSVQPTLTVRSPGRVNLLGEHTDYNDGPVLPAAIDRAVLLAAAPFADSHSSSRIVHLYANNLESEVSFSLDNLLQKVDLKGNPLPAWAMYPAGVAWALQEAGLSVRGVRAAYASDVPIGAGLSSSAAVEVGFAVLWQALGGWEYDRLKLAVLCQRAENEYVGLSCGLMDQFACAMGVAGHALFFDTRSLEWEPAPLPPDSLVIIADSSQRRSLTTSAYNERRAACEEAVRLLQKSLPNITSLRDVKTTEFAAYGAFLPEVIRRRAEHVVKEIQRVQTAVIALKRGDKQTMGALMYAGHRSLRDLYEVSTPQLDTLVELTRSLPGTIGARLTGAGFGGCTVNLVEAEHATDFIQGLKEGYAKETGLEAQVFLCQASQGAHVEEIP